MNDLIIGLADAKPPPDSVEVGPLPDPDGDDRPRCFWGASTLDYAQYHDTEWGRATVDERTLFEKLCLEGFQSGLSWLTILRKRPGFRRAFADFEPATVAQFDEGDVERLLQDAAIVRHRKKIEAAITNARAMVELWDDGGTLAQLVWSFEPADRAAPKSMSDIESKTAESTALSKALKGRGFVFVGPTTAYASMQAMGVVNDHFEQCWVRDECERLRSELRRP